MYLSIYNIKKSIIHTIIPQFIMHYFSNFTLIWHSVTCSLLLPHYQQTVKISNTENNIFSTHSLYIIILFTTHFSLSQTLSKKKTTFTISESQMTDSQVTNIWTREAN